MSKMVKTMLITPMNSIEGKKIREQLGLITASYVASRAVHRDFIAGIRNFLGLEIKEYTQMMEIARQKAVERMIAEAETWGADAILNVRFVTSPTSLGSAEIMVYGDAVIVSE